MSYNARLWTIGIVTAATIPIVQMVATAATAPDIAKTAKAITVQITEPGSRGSGVILQRQGDIYTVLTNEHVLRAKNVPYNIVTSDGKKYQAIASSIRLPAIDIDLAVVKFRASDNYPTAKLGNCNLLTEGMDLYVGGYPAPTVAITNSVFLFRTGTVSANSNQTLEKGYSLIYSNDTLPGMSGGAVLNQNGELVAIHGKGDVQKNPDGEWGGKTGFNLGIPINQFATIAGSLGVDLDGKVAAIPKNTQLKAGDYLALGIQKFRKRDYRGAFADFNQSIQLNSNSAIAHNYRGFLKGNKFNDIQGALADLNQAIRLDPNYAKAHNYRGLLKSNKLNDLQGALADYNQSIRINPNYAAPYNNRGSLKNNKFNDSQGALADYNQSIRLDPNNASSYNNRGSLKDEKLNDSQGALADYDQAIRLGSNFALAYTNRGLLKYQKLNDRSGGIADMQKAARLSKHQNNLAVYQKAIDQLQKWETSANNTGF